MILIANRYQLMEKLGQGGMGEVYRGLDTLTQSPVAIKNLRAINSSDPEILERFRREGSVLRDLNHPNIVKMLDMIQHDDAYYLVMEYIEGGDLASLLKTQGKLSVPHAIKLALELADALSRAHHLGIIHRDIKPANVLIAPNGTPRLTDFGVARIEAEDRLTGTGVAVGTLDYMPPEAINGEAVDTRADIWAFGVMLYEMLTGHRPFAGETTMSLLTNILMLPVPSLVADCPEAPPALQDLIAYMLQKERENRLPSARQMGAALEAISQGKAVNLQRLDTPSKPTVSQIKPAPDPAADAPTTTYPPAALPPVPLVTASTPMRRLPIIAVSAAALLIVMLGAALLRSSSLAPALPSSTPPATATLAPTNAAQVAIAPSTGDAPAPDGYHWVNAAEVRLLMPDSWASLDLASFLDLAKASIAKEDSQKILDGSTAYINQQRSVAFYVNWLNLQGAALLVEDTGVSLSNSVQVSRMRELGAGTGWEFIGDAEEIQLSSGTAQRLIMVANAIDMQATVFMLHRDALQYVFIFAAPKAQADTLEPIIKTVMDSVQIGEPAAQVVPTANAPLVKTTLESVQIAKSTPTVPPTATAAPISASNIPEGWKTVPGNGFSLALPQNWLTLPATSGLMEAAVTKFSMGSVGSKNMTEFTQIADMQMLFGQIADVTLSGGIAVAKSQESLDLFEALFQAMAEASGDDVTVTFSDDIMVQAGTARRMIATSPVRDDQPAFVTRIDMIQTSDKVYFLLFLLYKSQYEALAPTFDQIAQTLTVPPVPTPTPAISIPEGWKTVQGTGFSMAIPANWMSLPANTQLMKATVSEFISGSDVVKSFNDLIEQFDVQIVFGQITNTPIAGAVANFKSHNSLDFYEALLMAIIENVKNSVILDRIDMTLPAGPASRVNIYWPAVGDKPAFEGSLLLIQTPDAVYMVTAVTNASEFEALAPTLDQIAQTFTVIP